MDDILQGLIIGSSVCVVLLTLVIALHSGTAGHSAPARYTRDRAHGL
jgi:hypothetical protein